MAPSFPHTFEKDSPMSPQSAISYQTNVNRQKTKKWTEAKPVDYGGDDWGDDDDYDLPPPPISKPTGLRQPGQGLASSSRAESPAVDNSRKYGELPALPAASNTRQRANSFDADDEKRDFSNSSSQPPPASNAPATRFSQITGVSTPRIASGPPALSISTQQPAQPPPVGLGQSSHMSPVVESPHPEVLLPGAKSVNTGESSIIPPVSDARPHSTTSDFHARRDFSPSAVPPPLSTRASPAPQSATDSTPSERFPPRKSSLSQATGPPLSEIMGAGSQDTTPKPWIGARPASPGTGAKSPISPPKALPFIRPADIYRRAEEERRQSIESSGRPSMDSLMGSKSSDRSESPSKSYAKTGPDMAAARRRASFENDDGSDSGRRLMPMLEPVKERKSEYGFEGFNVNDLGPQQESDEQSIQERNLAVEDARRQSISPKLPDLGRMSGFGLDMFSSKDVDAIKESDSTPTTATLSSPEQDLKLREQPSFGFKSVVHQAFDTTDDQSLPDTPASRSGSGINRTDSESTGTGGISPIMSRVSSTAIPETRNRDISTPAIMEATEPDSPEAAGNGSRGDAFAAPQAPGFKPGHRRDISVPSSGNTVARTPDLGISNDVPGGQHAILDDTPADIASPVAEDPLRAPRPFAAEREESFRPSLPGGWTSYATTARSETPTQPAVQTPTIEVPPNHDDDDLDLTPTTTKRSLPGTSLGASIAGATLGGSAFGKSDRTSPSQTPVNELPRTAFGGSPTSPTSPSGALPSQLPKLEQAPAETQLRPDVGDRPVSFAPPPPPKDTPTSDSFGQSSNYFPTAPMPVEQKAKADDISHSPVRPPIIPTSSMDSMDDDQESDKLRREIVKSLTPTPSNATGHTSSTDPDQIDESPTGNPNRDSSYLPSEYDNYWATSDQEEEEPAALPVLHEESSEVPSTERRGPPGLESPVPAPLSPRRDDSLQPPRPSLQSRFSWEQSSENVSAGANPDPGYLTTDTSKGPHASELPGSVPMENEKEVAPQSEPRSADTDEDHHTRDAALLASGAALGAAAVTYSNKPEEKSRRMSLADEKDPRVSSNQVSPTPPEDEHPSRSPALPAFPTSPEAYQHPPGPPSTVSPVTSSVHPFAPQPPTGRLIAFREIVAMKSPQERIKTFDETRHRFAAMDSGLNDWMEKLQGQFPDEHSGVTGSWGNSRNSLPVGSARGKFSKATTGGPAAHAQQPYYQQYLNASSPTAPSTPVGGPRPGPSMPSGSQQGFSASGSKMTSQQVQAKGKELLHTAGIFGGKAGKAGKGLLAKGKNKLRAAGGGDKTSPSPSAQPKPDRRSSWGFPLSMSKSNGRPDAVSRNSREGTPTSALGRSRTNTLPSSERSSPAPQLPAVQTGYALGVMSGGLQPEHPETHRETLNPHPTSSFPAANETVSGEQTLDSEARDSLGVPAPIGKNQPSWDPFNATPIAEEDGFQYEERPQPRLSSDRNGNQDALAVPADNLAMSDRSSTDAPFFDAREETEEINNDWVMVSPEPNAQEPFTGASTKEPDSSVMPIERQSLDQPLTSILNQPRGSFSHGTSHQFPTQGASEPEIRPSIDSPPPTSILNRPRGSFSYDTPPQTSPTHQVQLGSPLSSHPLSPQPQQSQSQSQSAKRPGTPPGTIISVVPVQRTPSPPPARPVETARSTQPAQPAASGSSFLPPIRRTSTFGIGFGSRQPKQRFPIESDEERSPPRVVGQQQQLFPGDNEQPIQESHHKGAMAGAAVGAAGLAGAAGVASQGENRRPSQDALTRNGGVAEPHRPFSFHQTSAQPQPSQQPPLPSATENFGPPDDTNTWGVRDEIPPNLNHPPMPIVSGRHRKSSFPPPGYVSDPAPLKDVVGPQHHSDAVFDEEQDALAPRDDTNTWGVNDEPPPNLIHPPMPVASGKQRRESFPPPGFAVDREAHGPAQVIQPVQARSPVSKPALSVQTGSSNVQHQRQASFPPPGFQADSQTDGRVEAPRGVSLADVPSQAHARTNLGDSAPRPLSFQQTPPRESGGHSRQPSLPLSFTREPEEINRQSSYGAESSTQGSDPQRHMSMPPPINTRDPEKEGLYPPPRSPARNSLHGAPQQNLPLRDPKTMFTPPRADSMIQRSEFQESQVEWRPNRPKAATRPSQSSFSSESYGKETGVPAARTNSWDQPPPPRQFSTSSSYMQRQDSEKAGWSSPQPPSSANRYPDLFKTGQQQPVVESPRDVDLPDHYYQAPISRTQAFLPRQQTNEYQLPGVGPPEEPLNPARRNSFLRDISGRLSRGSSRERRTSISRDRERDFNRRSPDRNLDSRGDNADSIGPSDDGAPSGINPEHKKRRASFFGTLTGSGSRNSFSAQSPPKSRESTIVHHAASRTDLLTTPQPSPDPVKRSFFSSRGDDSTPKKLIRHSTTGTMDGPGKKKDKSRFSALGGLFGKGSPSKSPLQRPQAARELSQEERQPIESPQSGLRTPNSRLGVGGASPDHLQHVRAESQSRRSMLSKFSVGGTPMGTPDRERDDRKEKEREKSRRPSAAGLLNGFMGRKSFQKEKGNEENRSQGSSQPVMGERPLLAQTYSDIQDSDGQRNGSAYQAQQQHYQNQQQQPNQGRSGRRSTSQAREIPFQDPSLVNQDRERDRGRRVSREPQYDSVPIPGGYSLVRGQGAVAVQSEYDPRGLGRLQHQQQQQGQGQMVDPRYAQAQVSPPLQGQPQQHFQSPNLSPPPQQQQQQPSIQQYAVHPLNQPQPVPVSLPLPIVHKTSLSSTHQSHPLTTAEQQIEQQIKNLAQPKPALGTLETVTYRDFNRNHRISHEDILARSPPKPLVDQQRPYQLSLPGGGDEDVDLDSPTIPRSQAQVQAKKSRQGQGQVQNPTSTPTPSSRGVVGAVGGRGQEREREHPQRATKDPIQRLTQPLLRHPASPAGYPLPEDTVFSPVNPSAVDFPPPPPPKWPAGDGQDSQYQQHQRQVSGQGFGGTLDVASYGNAEADLDRSNTRRTAVSALSGISDHGHGRPDSRPGSGASNHSQGHDQNNLDANLHVPHHSRSNENLRASGVGGRVSPSPTPPSPMDGNGIGNGGRGGGGGGEVKRTDVLLPKASEEDLYSASPRLPRSESASRGWGGVAGSVHQRLSVGSHHDNKENHLALPKEGSRERGNGNGNGNSAARHPEEKIYYDNRDGRGEGRGQDGVMIAELEDHETSMSATSYPGQEWNPYAMGAWDDGDDVGMVGNGGGGYR